MKIEIVFIFLAIAIASCEHLIVGDSETKNKQLIHHEIAQYNAIPFTKRVKNVFFNSQEQRNITSIIAYDNLHSKAEASVTAGGVGYTYVNLRLKSERGKGLDYDIGIYS